MEPSDTIVTTARIGQRGRLILPAQVQRATNIASGDLLVVRTTEDGTITLEPIWAAKHRLRTTYGARVARYWPSEPARLHAGGRTVEEPGPLPIPLQPHDIPGWPSAVAATAGPDEQLAVLTARAVLAWFMKGPDSLVDRALPHTVLPEAAVTELVTAFARVGHHSEVDPLLADLAVLGVQMPGSESRATLAQDTAHALQLAGEAARQGIAVSMPDALCAAAAVRLELPLIAADLHDRSDA